jgi:hypothetical protein
MKSRVILFIVENLGAIACSMFAPLLKIEELTLLFQKLVERIKVFEF